MPMSPLSLSPEDDKLQKSKSIDGCLYLFFPKKKMYVKKQSFLCLYAPRSCIQYYVIIFVSDLWQVSGFLQVSFTNKTNHHNTSSGDKESGDIDIIWLLIYFMILWAFYLFKVLKSKCHQIGKYQ
jgi:hypothetical protein